jgi:hypothetical protein
MNPERSGGRRAEENRTAEKEHQQLLSIQHLPGKTQSITVHYPLMTWLASEESKIAIINSQQNSLV